MSARIVADLLVLAHLAFIVFVVFGALLVARRSALAWLHLPAAAWGAWIELSSSICPLTPLENRFRRLAGEQGYAGGFIEHYVVALIYPEPLTARVQWWLGAAVLALNACAYAWIVVRARRRRARDASAPR